MIMVNGANRHDSMMFEKCMVAIPAIEGLPGRARKRPAKRMRTKAKTTSAAGPASNDETSPAGLHEEVSRAAKSMMLLKAKGHHRPQGLPVSQGSSDEVPALLPGVALAWLSCRACQTGHVHPAGPRQSRACAPAPCVSRRECSGAFCGIDPAGRRARSGCRAWCVPRCCRE